MRPVRICGALLLLSLALASPAWAGPPVVVLTHDLLPKADLRFIDGGAQLVYTLEESPTQFSLLQLDLESGESTRLHPQADTSEFEAAYSANSQRMAFVQSRGNLTLRLVVRDLADNAEYTLEPGGGFSGMRSPTLAPDGSRVVISVPAGGGQHLIAYDSRLQDRQELTQGDGLYSWPAFSPDGALLACGGSLAGDYEIMLLPLDGGPAVQLTQSAGLDARPAWSPDGRRIAWTSNRDGNYEIYVCDRDRQHVQRITEHAERDDYPAWHPDGRLAWVREQDGASEIVLTEAVLE